jgi:hypothetical protein
MASRRAVLSSLAVVALFALPLGAELLGARRLVFRDAQITHWPWRRVAVAALESGQVPFVNAAASGGQPLLANPNAVLLYPTFLLERVAPAAVAFNLHYLLHVIWAFFGARRLARELGLADDAAFLSGVVYAFSGMVLSYGAAFMNSIAAAAWMPWCAAAVLALERSRGARETARFAAAAGLALGLQLLAGEPAISLLTVAFAGALALLRALARAAPERLRRVLTLAAGGGAAGALALALAAPLLLPLSDVFPLTYRGQHLFSESAFGAAALAPERLVEWALPRFGGDPGQLGGGANWLEPDGQRRLVYIWAVTLGIVPLLLLAAGALAPGFWRRRTAALAGGGLLAFLLAFGFALPLYRLVYEVAFLRRLRYPIKFYLVATLCAALLAGLAAEALARRGRAGRSELWVGAALLAVLAAAWGLAANVGGGGGALVRWAAPQVPGSAGDPAPFLTAFAGAVRGDAFLGAAAILAAVAVLRKGGREPGYLLGLVTLLGALVWGLPLFVTARVTELARPPALRPHLEGDGRLYVSPKLPRFQMAALTADRPHALPRFEKAARVILEQLVPATGSEFGIRYLFETDPDGSYGYYNRLANEAADASTPVERDRLLRLYGGRWVLSEEDDEHPLFPPVTGLSVAGRRLVLHEHPAPLPEIRWASRAWKRSSLSAVLELVRSERFAPETDVALPGGRDEDPAGAASAARLAIETAGPDRAAVVVDADSSGFLVFSRTYFPAWRARIGGVRVPLTVANARELAVAVPAGRSRIELEYDRRPFRRGVALQAAGLLAGVGVAAAAFAARRKP